MYSFGKFNIDFGNPLDNEEDNMEFQPEQRVSLTLDGIQRQGTVKEVHPRSGFIRVEVDRATMHEWVNPEDLTLIGDVPQVGNTVTVPFLKVDGEIIEIKPPLVEGGVIRYQIRWWEPAALDYRDAGFWRSDFIIIPAPDDTTPLF